MILWASVLWFIASFFICGYLPFPKTVGMAFFAGNLLTVSFGMMFYARRVREKDWDNARHVGKIAERVTDEELALLEGRAIPCTVHRFRESTKTPPYERFNYWVEFHSDDDRLLFILSRPPRVR